MKYFRNWVRKHPLAAAIMLLIASIALFIWGAWYANPAKASAEVVPASVAQYNGPIKTELEVQSYILVNTQALVTASYTNTSTEAVNVDMFVLTFQMPVLSTVIWHSPELACGFLNGDYKVIMCHSLTLAPGQTVKIIVFPLFYSEQTGDIVAIANHDFSSSAVASKSVSVVGLLPTGTATHTSTPTPTPTPTPTATATATATSTATATETSTPIPTQTATATETPSPTPTNTVTAISTPAELRKHVFLPYVGRRNTRR